MAQHHQGSESFPDAPFDSKLETFPDAPFDPAPEKFPDAPFESFPDPPFETQDNHDAEQCNLEAMTIDGPDSGPVSQRCVYILRHGEREDDVNPEWSSETPWDPPLTKRGQKQARETGLYLADKNIKAIYTSPFSRCLETTKYVLEGIRAKEEQLGICHERKIRIENGLSEFHNEKWFREKPQFYHNAHILEEKDESYQSMMEPNFPETTQAMLKRYSTIGRRLASHHAEDEGSLLLVTHGFAIDPITKELLKDNEIMILEASYCCLTTLKLIGNNCYKLISLASSTHLKKS
jgi:broad specificity phosphatase PhoE